MGLGDAFLETHPLAEHQGESQTGCTGVDVHSGATGEVVDPESGGSPAIGEVEDPVGDREIHQGRPHGGEDQPGAELGTVGDRTRDQCDGDDGEGGLEAGERQPVQVGREGSVFPGAEQPTQAEQPGRVAEETGDQRRAEDEPVAVEHPQHTDNAHRAEAHHHHADDALRLHHSAVEEGNTGSHQKHEGGRDEEPQGIEIQGYFISCGVQQD